MKLAVFASLLMIIPFQAEANTCVNKKVLVWVTHGKNLGDGLQSPDPYVVVKINSYTQKSRVIDSSSNPEWWEELQFPEATNKIIEIEVWDKKTFTPDDKLGACTEQLLHEGQSHVTIRCRMNNNTGVVNILYNCN